MNLRSHFRHNQASVPVKDNSSVIHGALSTDLDTATALEDLLDQVWRSEADWRLNDRIDLAYELEVDSVAS